MEADSDPFWIGARRVRRGGMADAAFGLRLLLSQHPPPKDTSKEGLFDRGVLLIPNESILRSMCPSEKALEVCASGERSESFAHGKRFAVAKLTASLSPRAKLRPRLLVTSRLPSPEIQVSTTKDLLIPRGRAGLEASLLSPISPLSYY